MGPLEILSAIFGWVYFLCWSASFYPQPVLNWGRASTSGTTVDFPFLNVIGFAAYFASNAAFYYSPTIRAQYAARHNDLTPTVAFNDIVFALHGLILSVITASQYLLAKSLWGFPPSVGARPSRLALGIGNGCVVGVLLTVLIVATAPYDDHPARAWCALDIVYAVGYVKLVVTLVKYVPQMLANWRNKSTRGWSIWQILLDFSGGVLSIAQQGIDSWLQGDWSGITGNPVKFALGNASMVYDVIFMVQHYVLYPGGKADRDQDGDSRGEHRRLMDEERRIV
ncbi:Cystinosin-like protein [Emericellopsis cladophorae]|uniref:Cystinosin-like protein n=1 Tax=Emericellopsis cladophorae TaxID=2686198 RepID=A0A9Q0BEY0_9HYPO|nr:Cystinosin-like protein [Emericellopsis cladophorae]KAI6782902.1 Cystinosin-like protein [Emericellopsis cladophorae]